MEAMYRLLMIIPLCYAANSDAYYYEGYMSDNSWTEDWPDLGRPYRPKCVDIPNNLTLCQGIGYTQMRLPNLLDHDTLREVSQQAASWKPLLGIRCHPDTQIFLCSLFSPVCMERAIYPCRTLCEAVQKSCEANMLKWGYPWPDMVRCDKFPQDNDLCIGLRNSSSHTDDKSCNACSQPNTLEGIVDSYCSSDFAIRASIKNYRMKGNHGRIKMQKKWRFYKKNISRKDYRTRELFVENGKDCECHMLEAYRDRKTAPTKRKYFVMGKKTPGNRLYVTFIQEFNRKQKSQKQALRMIRKNPDICKKGVKVIATEDDKIPQGVPASEVAEGEKGGGMGNKKRGSSKQTQKGTKDRSTRTRKDRRKKKSRRNKNPRPNDIHGNNIA